MSIASVIVLALVTGTHAATWGAFKDAPFEGFKVTSFVRTLALAVLAAESGVRPVAADSSAATVPAAFVGIPGVKLRYYDVSGRTAAEIRASLNRSNSVDPATGVHFDAYTEWDFDWSIPGAPGRSCRLDRAKVTLELTVGLPRLVETEGVPPELLGRWHRYRAALEAHEATHARNAVKARHAVLAAIRGADCATADEAAGDVLDELDYRDEDYDRLTRHGATEGAFFPEVDMATRSD